MTTLNQRRVVVFKIQKKLSDWSLSQLQTVASSINDGRETCHVADLSKPKLYDLIVNYTRSEKLKAAEDQGMTQLLCPFDLLNVLSAPDTRAAEPGNVAPDLMGDPPTHHHGHTPTDDAEEAHTSSSHMNRDIRTQPLLMDGDTHTQPLHMDRDICLNTVP